MRVTLDKPNEVLHSNDLSNVLTAEMWVVMVEVVNDLVEVESAGVKASLLCYDNKHWFDMFC